MAKRKPIEQMSDEERREYQDKLLDEIRGHVSKSGDGMTRREQLEKMSHEQRSQYIRELQNEVLARLRALFGKEPAPAPVDDLDDDEQIDNLRRLWGES